MTKPFCQPAVIGAAGVGCAGVAWDRGAAGVSVGAAGGAAGADCAMAAGGAAKRNNATQRSAAVIFRRFFPELEYVTRTVFNGSPFARAPGARPRVLCKPRAELPGLARR